VTDAPKYGWLYEGADKTTGHSAIHKELHTTVGQLAIAIGDAAR